MRIHPRILIAAAALATVVLFPAQPASGGTWVSPIEGGAQVLSFGASCSTGTHRGVDVAARAGTTVLAPAAGVVSFAGSVPADGGGTCGAVTIELPDGLRVSILPLDIPLVSEGDSVAAGAELGLVSARGDGSTGDAHIHIGLRRGDLYLDPGPYLGVGATTSDADHSSAVIATPAVTLAPTPVESPHTPSSPVAQMTAGYGTTAVGTACDGAETAASAAESAETAAGRAPTVDAGVPQPTMLAPSTGRARGRRGVHATPLTARSGTAVLLLAGMCAVAVGIVATRRFSPVREC